MMETMKWREREAFESDVLTTGLRVYVIGHKNGRFEGRWNGIWNLPLKIADAVNFGISRDDVPIDWLPDFCKEFAFGGDVERTFEIGELSIDQCVFVPKFKRGVCWIFKIKNSGDTKVAFNFIANPVTNLEWELKQTGDVWKEKKYLPHHSPYKTRALQQRSHHSLIFRIRSLRPSL